MNGLQQKPESSLKLLNDGLCKSGEVNARVPLVDVLGELGDTFCVGFGLKNISLVFQEGLQFLVVCDDTVVDYREMELWVTPIQKISNIVLHIYFR